MKRADVQPNTVYLIQKHRWSAPIYAATGADVEVVDHRPSSYRSTVVKGIKLYPVSGPDSSGRSHLSRHGGTLAAPEAHPPRIMEPVCALERWADWWAEHVRSIDQADATKAAEQQARKDAFVRITACAADADVRLKSYPLRLFLESLDPSARAWLVETIQTGSPSIDPASLDRAMAEAEEMSFF